MYDINHIFYTIISCLLTALILVVSKRFVCSENKKRRILQCFAWSTVILHYSSIYVTYLQTGSAIVDDSMLFPIYPCNVAMWLLLIASLLKNKETFFYKTIAEFTFYLGVVGGIIGLIFNENYMNNPNMLDWNILKGLLSHSTLIAGGIYLLVGDFIKIRVSNVISVVIGLLFLIVDGIIIISIYKLSHLEPPNCMYLINPPFDWAPRYFTFLIGIVAVIVVFIFTSIYEMITLEKEKRWYYQLSLKKVH